MSERYKTSTEKRVEGLQAALWAEKDDALKERLKAELSETQTSAVYELLVWIADTLGRSPHS